MPGRWSRRTLLRTAAAGSAAAIAGCPGAVGAGNDQGTPTCPQSNDTAPYDAVVEVEPAAERSDPRATVRYTDLSADQRERVTVRYADLYPDQQVLVDEVMAETGGDGRYRVCVAELSRSERVTLEGFARRAREKYVPDESNAVYLEYEGDHYALAVRIEDVVYAPHGS